ncbi:hypothetical protein FGRMN_10206 [Fusarium graminum]|nr:hypothetical protein FGRMN_10206 [Fusarium graminum]
MSTSHLTVENFCRPEDLGGRYTASGGDFFEVIRRWMARTPRRRSLSIAKKAYALAEYERLLSDGRDDEISQIIDANHTEIAKRQDQGEWINLVTQQGVTKPGVRHRINTIELSPGIEITWTEGS